MAHSAADETVYIKVNGKYVAYGRVWDREALPYGCWFVENKRNSRGLRKIEAMPEFIGLESAIEASKDELCKSISEYMTLLNGKTFSYWELTEAVAKAVRNTLVQKQREAINILKHGHQD